VRKTSSVILAVTFLCTAIFEFLHTISFQGMPGFLSDSDMHKSLSFWLLSRFIVAGTLFSLAIKRNDAQISNNKALGILGTGLGFTFFISSIIFLTPQFLPLSFLDAQGQTLFTRFTELTLTALNIANAFLFFRQTNLEPTSDIAHLQIKRTYLFLASCMLALSQVYFSLHLDSREHLALIGHIFQLFAALAIYRSMVAINIHAPYTTLANASLELHAAADELTVHKKRLTGIIETAIDGIVTIDKTQKIVVINPAAAAMFGYTVEALQHKSLDEVIPVRHRKNHGEHVNKFGDTGATKRKMGSSFEDFYVTGLRADGTEFPIEASISSSLENGERFYTVIFRDITERKIAKDKLALYHTQLSQLSTALQSIREEERKHIARELHDDLGQLLAALRMDLSLLQRDSLLTEKTQKTVHSMDQLLLTSITTLRRIASDLRPKALDEGGLFYALKTLQKDFSNRHQIDCELIADEEQLTLDDAHSTAIFRVIQESLTNVARHASASEVQIEFQRDASSISFSIRDNGRGIDEEDMKKTRSFGLVGMRERVKAMDGEFTVISMPGEGTNLEIKLPLSTRSDVP
ncbi:MAG: MASE3 domain-containing protein, partial [Pseudomonadota bacterium]